MTNKTNVTLFGVQPGEAYAVEIVSFPIHTSYSMLHDLMRVKGACIHMYSISNVDYSFRLVYMLIPIVVLIDVPNKRTSKWQSEINISFGNFEVYKNSCFDIRFARMGDCTCIHYSDTMVTVDSWHHECISVHNNHQMYVKASMTCPILYAPMF